MKNNVKLFLIDFTYNWRGGKIDFVIISKVDDWIIGWHRELLLFAISFSIFYE